MNEHYKPLRSDVKKDSYAEHQARKLKKKAKMMGLQLRAFSG